MEYVWEVHGVGMYMGCAWDAYGMRMEYKECVWDARGRVVNGMRMRCAWGVRGV